MQLSEFAKPITSKSLNESLAKKFGSKINLEKFTLEQLQDARNKIRTSLSQVETNESFNSVQDETYQKSKMMLDVINAAISERGDIEDESIEEGEVPAGLKAYQDKKNKGKKPAKKDHGKRPDSPDLDDDGDTNEPIAQAAKQAKESVVREGAEDHAELVMAAKEMVDRVTGWMEDTAEMQSDSMLELADAIRDEKGQADSEAFTNTVKPSLDSLYGALEATRTALTAAVGQLTGEGSDMMGAGDDMGMDPEMEPTMGDDEMPADDMGDPGDALGGDDDFGGAEAATGGDEPMGREKRESIDRVVKKVAKESTSPRKLANILSKKK